MKTLHVGDNFYLWNGKIATATYVEYRNDYIIISYVCEKHSRTIKQSHAIPITRCYMKSIDRKKDRVL